VGDRLGLILDYGGVLTSSPFASFEAFCGVEGLAPDAVRERFRDDPEARVLLAELETGKLPAIDFERAFAASLDVAPEALLQRMFGGMRADAEMIDGIRALRRERLHIGLLSNSVGDASVYDRALMDELFDAWVISSEVGLRKPDPAIYELAAERIGRPAEACVYVDDLPGNLKPARALGMATVLHRGDALATLAEVRALLG
jgi:epoxide hydrolase-like predicted phosphatase